MAGKIFASFIATSIFIYFMLAGLSFYSYLGESERISELSYDVAELVSTKRVFSTQVYAYLNEKVSKMGDYAIEYKLEIGIKDGYADTYYKLGDILDRELDRGDRLTIVIYSQSPSFFENLTGVVLRPASFKLAIVA